MPRGKNNHNNRGRGNGSSRGGGWVYRGRGGVGSHLGRNQYTHSNAEIDPVIQQWEAEPLDAGGSVNRGNGQWRGGTPRSGAGTPLRGTYSPRRGSSTPRGAGRGRGRGRGGNHFFNDSSRPRVGLGAQKKTGSTSAAGSLSDLLNASRPLLRPVKFVRATLTPFLFQESEELLNPVSEEIGTTEDSHVPTAEHVARVFSGGQRPSPLDSEPEGEASDHLEEVDFADLGKFRAGLDAVAGVTHESPQEELQEIDFADLAMIRAEVNAAVPAAKLQAPSRSLTVEEAFTGVYNIKDTVRSSNSMDIDVQQESSLGSLSTGDAGDINVLQRAIEVLDVSTNSASAQARDGLVVEEERPSSSTASMDTPMAAPREVLSTLPPHLHATSNIPAASSPEPEAPLIDDVPPLFVIDTKPTRPFAKRSASDVILVDRIGRGETLGEEDELIVYVAPHPRSGRASPIPQFPRVKLPTSSIPTSKSSISTSGIRSPVREDEDEIEDVPNDVTARRDQTQPEPPSISSLSLNFSSPVPTKQPRTRPVFTPSERSKAALKSRTKEKRIRRNKGRSAFASFGAMLSEARLREEDERDRRHPKWETRRRGDSDVDWGSDEEEGVGRRGGEDVDDEVDEVSDGLGGMDVDPELELDANAVKGFVKSMSAEGSRFRTIDDIEDEARMRQEDEAGAGGPTGSSDSGSSDEEEDCEEDAEEEMIFNVEEEILIAESGGEGDRLIGDKDSEDISEDSSDDDGKRSPASSFQARLQKVRDRYQGPLSKAAQEISDDDDSSGDGFPPWERGAEDEAFLTRIEDILEKNSEVLLGRDRKQRKKLLRNLHQGYADDYDDFMETPDFSMPVKKGKKGKGKGKAGDIPPELQAQWGKDRAKKAEYKRQRQEARLLAALDPTTPKKGGKKSRKATLATSKLDPEVATSMVPNAIVDMASVEAQIRRFVANIGGTQSMALPPMDSASRKKVHQLADALNLKSKSKGGGVGRYTTLIKTTRTGTRINEDKVNALRKRFGKTFDRAYDRKEGKGGKEKEKVPRHRDGDVVGKAAPKIGQDNVGFKLLASMGWSEGGLIGGTASVGIEAPLTARIKNSKLGLGAK